MFRRQSDWKDRLLGADPHKPHQTHIIHSPDVDGSSYKDQMRNLLYPLAAMFGVQVIAAVANFAVPVLATEMAPDVGVAPAHVGLYSAIVYTATMVSGLVAGSFIASQGAVRTAQLALVAVAAGLLVATLSTPVAIVVAAVLIGVCYGPVGPAGSHLLVRVTEPRWRPLVFSIKQTGVTAGGLLAGVGLPAIALVHGWRTALLVVAAGALATILAVQPLRRRADADRESGRRVSRRDLFASLRLALGPSLRRVTWSSVMFAASQGVLSAFFVVFLVETVKLTLPTAGLVFAVVQGAGIAGRILCGFVAGRHIDAQRLLAVLALVVAGCFAALVAVSPATPLWALTALATVIGATAYGWNGVMLAEWAALAPNGRVAEATGGVQFVMFGGSVTAPALVGLAVTGTGGYTLPFAALVMVALANVVLMLWPAAPQAAVEDRPGRSG